VKKGYILISIFDEEHSNICVYSHKPTISEIVEQTRLSVSKAEELIEKQAVLSNKGLHVYLLEEIDVYV